MIRHLIKRPIRYFVNNVVDYTNNASQNCQQFRRHNERPTEYEFVFRHVRRSCPKTVLDVGTGQSALPALLQTCGCVVTASDSIKDYWPEGMVNRHWYVVDDDITRTNLPSASFEMVTCISVLEHIEDHRAAMRGLFSLLTPGGCLIITCPYTENRFVENCYVLPECRAEYRGMPFICRSYSRYELDVWLDDSGGEVVEQEYWRIETGSVHATGEWLFPAEQVARQHPHQLTCLVLRRKPLAFSNSSGS